MTGLEIAALAEAGLQLVVKIVELVQAANKGDVTAAEVLKQITEHTSAMDAAKAEARAHLDEIYGKGDKP